MIEISDALLDEIIEAHAADVAGMPCDDLASLAVDVLRDYKRLRRELEKRAKQLGVACDKHDLTHALACGRCLAEAREWILSAPHLYSCALLKPYDQRVICTCGRDALLAAMAEPLEVQP